MKQRLSERGTALGMRDNNNIKMYVATIVMIFSVYAITNAIIYSINESKEYDLMQQILAQQEDTRVYVHETLADMQQDIHTLEDDTNRQLDELYEAETETKLLEVQIELNAVDQIEDPMEHFIAYMEVCERYKDWVGMPITIYDMYSDDEIYLLQRMVETETHGADFMSKVHVAEVVLNRIDNERWPNTMEGVITQDNQFAYDRTTITESTERAVEYAFMMEDDTQGALSFHSMAKTDTFGRYVFYMNDGSHNFYGEKRGSDE